MQFHIPSVVQAPERTPEVVPLEAGVEGAADVAGVEATGLDSAGLDAAAPDALGAAVAFPDGEPAVVAIVGTMEMSDTVELAYGAEVAVAPPVVKKTPPAVLGLAPSAFGVVDAEDWDGEATVTMVDGTTTPGLVDGMVTEVAIAGD